MAFSVSLFAQGPGGLLFERIGGSGVRGFFLDLIGLQMVWSSCLSEAMYAVKAALLSSCNELRSLLFALLKRRLSSGVWFFLPLRSSPAFLRIQFLDVCGQVVCISWAIFGRSDCCRCLLQYIYEFNGGYFDVFSSFEFLSSGQLFANYSLILFPVSA